MAAAVKEIQDSVVLHLVVRVRFFVSNFCSRLHDDDKMIMKMLGFDQTGYGNMFNVKSKMILT